MSMAPVTTKDHSRYPLSEGPPEITLISRHSTVLSWSRPSRCEHGRAGSIPSLGSTGKTGFGSLGSRDLTPTLVHCSGGKLALRTGELVPPLAVLHLIWAAQQSRPAASKARFVYFFSCLFSSVVLRLQARRVNVDGWGNEWDWAAGHEIHKGAIKKFFFLLKGHQT